MKAGCSGVAPAGAEVRTNTVSIDPSLKIKGGLAGKRSVYTRAERVEILKAERKIDPKNGKALGLPKVRIRD